MWLILPAASQAMAISHRSGRQFHGAQGAALLTADRFLDIKSNQSVTYD